MTKLVLQLLPKQSAYSGKIKVPPHDIFYGQVLESELPDPKHSKIFKQFVNARLLILVNIVAPYSKQRPWYRKATLLLNSMSPR